MSEIKVHQLAEWWSALQKVLVSLIVEGRGHMEWCYSKRTFRVIERRIPRAVKNELNKINELGKSR